jgi:hypothetical protein
MLSQSHRHPGLKAFHFEAFFTWEAAEPARRPISLCLTPVCQDKAMAEKLASQAWFVRIRTSEATPAFIDYAIAKGTSQEAIAAILHRPEIELDDQVTSISELTDFEIRSYRLRPDEVRTYGRRIYNAKAGRWILDRETQAFPSRPLRPSSKTRM